MVESSPYQLGSGTQDWPNASVYSILRISFPKSRTRPKTQAANAFLILIRTIWVKPCQHLPLLREYKAGPHYWTKSKTPSFMCYRAAKRGTQRQPLNSTKHVQEKRFPWREEVNHARASEAHKWFKGVFDTGHTGTYEPDMYKSNDNSKCLKNHKNNQLLLKKKEFSLCRLWIPHKPK